MKGYTQISLPKELHKSIEKFITENPELGYKSVAEFIKDSVRRLFEIKQMQKSDEYKKIIEDMKKIKSEIGGE